MRFGGSWGQPCLLVGQFSDEFYLKTKFYLLCHSASYRRIDEFLDTIADFREKSEAAVIFFTSVYASVVTLNQRTDSSGAESWACSKVLVRNTG